MNILVTGASGGYGSLALQHLKNIAPNANLFALDRNPDNAPKWEAEGIVFRSADYSDLDGLTQAFEGIDRLLFVSIPNFNIQKNVVEAAKRAGVKYIAYTSLFALEKKNNATGLESNHLQTEELIKASGIPYVILRNTWYFDLHFPLIKIAQQTGKFIYYTGENKITGVEKTDLAEVGARVIADGSYSGVLDLASEPFSYREFALATEKILNKNLKIKEVTQEEFEQKVAQTQLSQLETLLATVYHSYTAKGNNGEETANPNTIESILSRPLASLEESIRKMIG